MILAIFDNLIQLLKKNFTQVIISYKRRSTYFSS